ncbi:MAG: hypothetical protein NVS3B3_15300 [Aquirhabdus sp.]
MSILQTDPQYKLRLPLELKKQIEVSAKDNNRSINADIVARLNDSFLLGSRTSHETIVALEALLLSSGRSARRTEVSQRLEQLLADVNDVKPGRPLKPSHVAQAIGENYAEIVENWFTGKQEPSFQQLEVIAQYLGGTTQWLQHGDWEKFPIQTSRVPESAVEGVSWLLDLDQDEQPTDIYFVRSKSETGELIIIKKYGVWRCVTHTTPYHVSEKIGNGGESSLAHLLVIWRLLYEKYRKTNHFMVKSYLLPDEQFSVLGRGEIHPLKVLRYATEALWWEDIWDSNMYHKANYWEGWSQLCERMNRVVEAKPFLNEQVQLIQSGSILL